MSEKRCNGKTVPTQDGCWGRRACFLNTFVIVFVVNALVVVPTDSTGGPTTLAACCIRIRAAFCNILAAEEAVVAVPGFMVRTVLSNLGRSQWWMQGEREREREFSCRRRRGAKSFLAAARPSEPHNSRCSCSRRQPWRIFRVAKTDTFPYTGRTGGTIGKKPGN